MEKFKSFQSDNKYALIAKRGEISLGLNVKITVIGVTLRFCVFSSGEPKLKHFSIRGKPGTYTNVDFASETKMGASCEKVEIKLNGGGSAASMNSLKMGEMDRLITWVQQQVEKEGMSMVVTDADLCQLFNYSTSQESVFVLPTTLKPEPIAKKEPKPWAGSGIDSEEEFDESNDFLNE